MLGVDLIRQFIDMKVKLAIVLPPRFWAGAVYLTQELLASAGTLYSHSADIAGSALFDVRLVGPTRQPVASFTGPAILPDVSVRDKSRYDVVIAPPQFAPGGELEPGEAPLARWIALQHRQGALVISLSGAVLLAKTGLLDNQPATGLQGERAIFAGYFPSVRFTPNLKIVVNGQLICAGGINPTADVCAYIVERYYGKRVARKFIRHTATESLNSGERLAVWSSRYKQHQDARIVLVQQTIESSLAQTPALATLAQTVHLSERTLSRRFAELSGVSLRSYVALCRLEMARILLRDSRDPLTLVAQQCGYGSVSALVHAFGKEHGISPQRYRHEAHQDRSD